MVKTSWRTVCTRTYLYDKKYNDFGCLKVPSLDDAHVPGSDYGKDAYAPGKDYGYGQETYSRSGPAWKPSPSQGKVVNE